MADPFHTQRDVVVDLVTALSAAGFEDAAEIGRGGFSVVYRCTQVGLGRVVAVKVLTAGFDEDHARFLREQQAMARLTGHPNIVAVLQVGETANQYPFLVMPCCRQGCIQDQIRQRGRLSVEEVLRVGVKIAGALESAHRIGIVHRDVKPANILLTDYGEPALSDFGIAHMSGGFQTATGIFTGSVAFTAPEVIGGAPSGTASDVYGLGATLFCALTGHAAFERRSGEQLVAQFLRIAAEPVPDLREHGIPADLTAVVQTAMAREPIDRPSALQLGEHLQHLQSRYGLVVDEMALQGTEGLRPVGRPVSVSVRTPAGRPPTPITSLVGRRAELAQLRELLSTSRLVTLSGVGGIGKTTLASHAATELARDFADGVWWVELGDLREGSLLVEVVAAALGVRDSPGRALIEVLVEVFGERHALVVLDNCEQIIDAAAELAQTLLGGCPRLQILATSREVLNMEGEAVLALAPLGCPDAGDEPTLRTLGGYDAVALFIERARAAVAGFTLTERNAAAVARICSRLDGVPLALELAAARLRGLSVDQIAEGLADRYALLTRGRRRAPPRQQTLAMCVGWSYELCTPAEQQLWGRLSVFAGSFDLPAAHEVCAPDLRAADLLDELCTLVDKSILIRTEYAGVVRFRLLDTLRDYGRARIADTAHYRLLRARHAHWYHRLLAEAEPELIGEHQIDWIHRLIAEMPNIREALDVTLLDAPASALEMTAALRIVWSSQGMFSEARRWLDLALDATPSEPTRQRIQALFAAAVTAQAQGDLSSARIRIAEARDLLQVVDNPVARAQTDWADGMIQLFCGDIERARACFQAALTGTNDFETQLVSTYFMGWLLDLSGDASHALTTFEKALALAESRGESVWRSNALFGVGVCRWRQGQPQRAEQALKQGLQLAKLIDDPWTGAQLLEALAWIAGNRDPRRAAVLMAAASAVNNAGATTLIVLPHLAGFHDECEARAREQLGAQDFDAAWSEGNQWTFEQAVALALQGDTPPTSADSSG